MPMTVTYWERRDNADRDSFAKAALNVCRASRSRPGIRSSRFYWLNNDNLVLQTEVDSLDIFNGPPPPEVAKALFALSDQARTIRMERWVDAGQGEQTYRQAQQAPQR